LGGFISIKSRIETNEINFLLSILQDEAKATKEFNAELFAKCVTVLMEVEDNVIHPDKLGMAMPVIIEHAYDFGFKRKINISDLQKQKMQTVASTILKNMTGLDLGIDVAKWESWEQMRLEALRKKKMEKVYPWPPKPPPPQSPPI